MIIEELIISIRKNKFLYLLMLVLFSIIFYLSNFMLCELQGILSADEKLQMIYDGEEYYFVYKEFEDGDRNIFYNSADRLNELKQFQNEVSGQTIYEYYLQNDQWLELVNFDNNTSFIDGYSEKKNDNRFEMFGDIYFRAKAYHISQNVFEKFIHKVEKGRMFDEKDFIYNTEYVPIVVGYNYGKQFTVGDILEGFLWNKKTKFKIIGILEENESILSFKTGDIEYLDNHILLPTLKFYDKPENAPYEKSQTEDERLLQVTAYTSYLNFIITMADGYELKDFIAYYELFREKYNIPDYYIANINMFAIEMLQLSNKEYYEGIETLMFLDVVFSFICFSVFLCLETMKNLNIYFVHMLLGANNRKVYKMVMFKAAVVIIPSQLIAFCGSMITIGKYSALLFLFSILLSALAIIPTMVILKRFRQREFYWRKE